MNSLTIETGAKINLGLWVGPRRSDGFHEILTTLVPIEFGDRLQIEKTKNGIEVITTGIKLDIPREKNLAYQAAQLFFKTAGIKAGCRIKIHKRVPPGSGLGGGSADAATTLIGLNRLFRYPLRKKVLHKLTLELGSDVRFFLLNSPAIARGRGEKLKRVQIPRLLILLYFPGFGISTTWAYQAIDHQRRRLTMPTISPKILIRKIRKSELTGVVAQLKNSFETIVFQRYPILRKVKKLMLENGCYAASLSGSGSVVYGLTLTSAPMRRLAELGIRCILTRSLIMRSVKCRANLQVCFTKPPKSEKDGD